MTLIADDRRPSVHFLVGLPGSGKSTWRGKHTNPKTVIVSQDDYIDRYAAYKNITYTEAFKEAPLKKFEEYAKGDFGDAIGGNQDIIIDRTNLTAASRFGFLRFVPDHYIKTAIVFNVPIDVLHIRLNKRAETTGKIIPQNVITHMLKTYQAPEYREGFDDIVTINSSDY